LIGHNVERVKELGQEVSNFRRNHRDSADVIVKVVKELDGKVISAGQLGDEKQGSKI